MKTDFWYGHNIKDVDSASVAFYPNDVVFRGWMYSNGRIIGDYETDDSIELQRIFPGIFK